MVIAISYVHTLKKSDELNAKNKYIYSDSNYKVAHYNFKLPSLFKMNMQKGKKKMEKIAKILTQS